MTVSALVVTMAKRYEQSIDFMQITVSAILKQEEDIQTVSLYHPERLHLSARLRKALRPSLDWDRGRKTDYVCCEA